MKLGMDVINPKPELTMSQKPPCKRQSLRERLATMTPEEFRKACRKTVEGDRTYRAARIAAIEGFLLDGLRFLEEDEGDEESD